MTSELRAESENQLADLLAAELAVKSQLGRMLLSCVCRQQLLAPEGLGANAAGLSVVTRDRKVKTR